MTAAQPWYPGDPREANEWLHHIDAVWWIAGGWAIDLYLGRPTRKHDDVDVGILRREAHAVLGALTGWEFFEAKDGVLTKLSPGAAPRLDVHSLWGRRIGTVAWQLEIMLDRAEGEEWVYRRAPHVKRPLAEVVAWTDTGLPYLVPEIQLLYKSKAVRPRDDEDFRSTMPQLTSPARAWLRDALVDTQPGHRWIAELGA